MKTALVKTVLAYVIFAVIFFLIGETGLRIFWKMNYLEKPLYRRSANKILRYEFIPGTHTQYENQQVDINSDGFRGPEFVVQKAPGTYRVVIVGDSVTFGRFNPVENNIASRLQIKLQALCPGRKVEVLNLGVEGYNTDQELEQLRTKGLKYQPDLVILYYLLNDVEDTEFYLEKNFWNRHFVTVRYFETRFKKMRLKMDRKRYGVGDKVDVYDYLYNSATWGDVQKRLWEMGDLAAQAGAPMVLLLYPELSDSVKDFREGFPYWNVYAKIEALKHPNITVVSPLREFSRLNLKKDEMRLWWYPTLQATDLIVDYLIDQMSRQNFPLCRGRT